MTEDIRTRAAGYIRVSQERNARDGYGLDAQEADVRRFAEYKGFASVEIYREAGGSGYERDRPELKRLIADAKAGRWDVAVFPSIDRAGRSVKDVIEIDRTLRKAGADVGAGPGGRDPIILERNGLPYRGFLEGRVRGDHYLLVLHLTHLELTVPVVPAEASP